MTYSGNLLEKGWKRVDAYKLRLSRKRELVATETINGRTLRTIEVYDIIEFGTVYKRNNEIKKVVEGTDKVFKWREFTNDSCSF